MADKYSNVEIRDLIFDFERHCNPFSYQVDGLSVWSIFRFEVYENLKINTTSYNARGVSSNLAHREKSKARLLLSTLPRQLKQLCRISFKKQRCRIIAISRTDRISSDPNNAHRNAFFDYFSPELPDTLRIFTQYRFLSQLKDYQHPYLLKYMTALSVVGLSWIKHGDDIKLIIELHGLLNQFLSSRGMADRFTIPESSFIGRYKTYARNFRVFSAFLRRYQPSLVMIETGHRKEWVIAASKKRSIPVWELQHGIIHDDHLQYLYDPRSARQWKDKLLIPQKILTYGDHYTRILLEDEFWTPAEIRSVGFPKICAYRDLIVTKDVNPYSKLTVLVSSQWILVELLRDFLTSTLLELNREVRILIKPHPMETADQTAQYRSLPGELQILETTWDFYRAISEADIHCGVFSTTLFESVGLGVPTIILNIPGFENCQSLIELGVAKFAQSPNMLANILDTASDSAEFYEEWREQTNRQKGDFWQKDSSNNMLTLLSEAGLISTEPRDI